jgi:hypothetical protein
MREWTIRLSVLVALILTITLFGLLVLGLPPSLPAQTPAASVGQLATAVPAQTPPVVAAALPPTIWQTRSPLVVQNGHITVDGLRKPLFGVTLDVWCRQYTLLTYNKALGVNQINSAGVALTYKELKSFRDAGGDLVRLLGDDAGLCNNIFSTTNTPQTTTRQLDPAALLAMDNLFAICDQLGLRILWTASFARQIQPGDAPPWSCPSFPEFTTQAYLGLPLGCNYPWRAYDTGARQFDYEYWGQFLNHVNSLTGVRYGDQIDLIVVENEHSLCKDFSWAYAAHPVLNGLFNSAVAAWQQKNNVPPAKFGSPQHYQFEIDTEAAVGQADIAVLKQLAPHALCCLTDYYGNGPYAMHAAGAQVADFLSVHAYSYQSSSELVANGGTGSGILNGQKPGDARTRLGAVIAGAAQHNPNGASMPWLLTEVGCVAQFNQLVNGKMQLARDADAERAPALAAIASAVVAGDGDGLVIYSWGHSGWMVNGAVQTTDSDPYDFSDDAVFLASLKQQIALFHDLTRRPTSTVTYTLSGGVTAGGSPYTDYPGLYAIPAASKVQLAP